MAKGGVYQLASVLYVAKGLADTVAIVENTNMNNSCKIYLQ